MIKWLLPIAALAAFLFLFHHAEGCNEAVCGSVVSKCLLTQSCKCDRKESCSCCKDCFKCLSYLSSECCSCVDLCPKPNDTGSVLSKQSYIEDFQDIAPQLFSVLTETPDDLHRWDTTVFPVDLKIPQDNGKNDLKIYMKSAEQETIPDKQITITFNCTVAYWSQCMSMKKCETSCQSMGSNSFRWFHDGCCECIGEHCINYGINESRCRECPRKEESPEEIEDAEMDYGEDMEFDDEEED